MYYSAGKFSRIRIEEHRKRDFWTKYSFFTPGYVSAEAEHLKMCFEPCNSEIFLPDSRI